MLFNPYEVLIDPILRNVRQLLPWFAGMKPGDSVLDVCCGTGAQVLAYAGQGITATGIDIDPRMIETAGKNKAKFGLRDASFRQADATTLPFNDGTFHYVSISFALHDKIPGIRGEIISEMKRVVRPDGALVLADFQVPLPLNFWGMAARSLEFLAGGSHYQGFRDYVAGNGLEKVLKDHRLREEKSGIFKGGILRITKVKLSSE